MCWPTWFRGSVSSLQFSSGLEMANSRQIIVAFFSQGVVTYIIAHPCFCDFIIFRPSDLSLARENVRVWLQGKGCPDATTRRYACWVRQWHSNWKDWCDIQTWTGWMLCVLGASLESSILFSCLACDHKYLIESVGLSSHQFPLSSHGRGASGSVCSRGWGRPWLWCSIQVPFWLTST
jgi:hypothetical protein